MLKLHAGPISPYARKVLVVLHETGLIRRTEVIATSTGPLLANPIPDQNPLGKIPCLITEDGQPIYDSRVICEYLDARHPFPKLIPAGETRWRTLTLEATADGILDAALLMVYEVRLRPTDKQSPDWVEAQWRKIAAALDALEADWIDHLNGLLDLGQIATGTALGYLDLRHSARDWREGRPKLTAWETEFAKRPSMLATIPT